MRFAPKKRNSIHRRSWPAQVLWFAVIAVCLAVPRAASAIDRIERKGTSSAVAGEITGATKTEITLQTTTGQTEQIPANEIERVRWDGEPIRLNLFRSDEAAGRLERAIEGYRQSLTEVAPTERLMKDDIEFLIARTAAKMALSDDTKRGAAIEALESYRNTHPNSFRYYEALDYLGQMYLLGNETEKANDVYRQLADAPWPDYKAAGELAKGELLLRQGDLEGSLAAYDAVLNASNDAAADETRRRQAILGKAAVLERQGQADEAAEMVQKLIDELPPDNIPMQAEAYLRMGDILQAEQKTKEAVLAYLHVDVLFPKDRASHAEALYHLARLWPVVGHPDRAADASNRLKQNYPNTEWAQKVSAN